MVGRERRAEELLVVVEVGNGVLRRREGSVRFTGGRLNILGLTVPLLPIFSVGDGSQKGGVTGALVPNIRIDSNNGLELNFPYYWRVDSHGLATRIQREMEKVCPAESGNRGKVRRRLRLTRNPDIPCVLVEIGYLSHASEARLCADPKYRDKMAAAIAKAILDQKANGDAGTGPLPKPIYAPPSRPTDPPGS